jgi:hypothetical protein
MVAYGRQKRIDSTSQLPQLNIRVHPRNNSETIHSKRNIVDPMPELTIISPYVDSRVDSNTFTMGMQPCARVDLDPMPQSTLSLGHCIRIWPLDKS